MPHAQASAVGRCKETASHRCFGGRHLKTPPGTGRGRAWWAFRAIPSGQRSSAVVLTQSLSGGAHWPSSAQTSGIVRYAASNFEPKPLLCGQLLSVAPRLVVANKPPSSKEFSETLRRSQSSWHEACDWHRARLCPFAAPGAPDSLRSFC